MAAVRCTHVETHRSGSVWFPYGSSPGSLLCTDVNFVWWEDDSQQGSHFQPNRLLAFPLFNLLSSQALNHR